MAEHSILIPIGFLIIFISVFFIFFTFDAAVNKQAHCLNFPMSETLGDFSVTTTQSGCSDAGMVFAIGLIVIGVFVLIDIAAVYIIFTALVPRKSMLLILKLFEMYT